MSTTKKKPNSRKASKPVAKKKTTSRARPQKANIPADWITQKEAVKLCRVSTQMFQRYGIEPVDRQGRCTYYTRDQILDWVERRGYKKGFGAGLREGRDAASSANLGPAELILEKERAELEWTQERAEGQRLKNAALRRELAPVAMVQWAISQAGSQIAAVLGTLKGRVKRAQPSLSSAALHEIEQIAVECQNTAADVRLDWDDFDESDLRDPRID